MATHDTEPPSSWRPLRAAVTLAVATLAAVGLVAVVHELARPAIEAGERARQTARLAAVLGGVRFDNDLLADFVMLRDEELLGTPDELPAHRARLHGKPVAVLLTAVAPGGYGGPIRLLVAVGHDGRLLGVRVLRHAETPGLGDAIDERRSDWIHAFAGRSLADPPPERWRVRRDGGDFDQFTGATVTPRAVVAAVANALVCFERHREELFAAPSSPAADERAAAR